MPSPAAPSLSMERVIAPQSSIRQLDSAKLSRHNQKTLRIKPNKPEKPNVKSNQNRCEKSNTQTRNAQNHTAPHLDAGSALRLSGMTAKGKKNSPQVSGLHQKGRMRNQHTKSEPAERSSCSRNTTRPRSNLAPTPHRSSRPPSRDPDRQLRAPAKAR